MFCIVGTGFLLLDSQLFHGGLWGSCSPADVAGIGPSGERHRRPDVWTFREPPVCHRDLSRSSRGTVPTEGVKSGRKASTYAGTLNHDRVDREGNKED